jgi:inner membrane protein
MTPGAHLLTSWILAENFVTTSRERRLVALAGIFPDIDGIGLIVDLVNRNKTEYYALYHHVFCHNLFIGLLVSAISTLFVKSNKLRLFSLMLCAHHLHLFSDLIGSKGPDGYQWPLPYFYPFAPTIEITWHGQWLLNGWQNLCILVVLFAWTVIYAIRHRRSFIEVISSALDRQIFFAVNKRWPA